MHETEKGVGLFLGDRSLTNQGACVRIDEHPRTNGPVAQLGARFHGMEEVVGSIPTRSTNLSISGRYVRNLHPAK
jgi:hypothetical protein